VEAWAWSIRLRTFRFFALSRSNFYLTILPRTRRRWNAFAAKLARRPLSITPESARYTRSAIRKVGVSSPWNS
jgi:hypothetical protein